MAQKNAFDIKEVRAAYYYLLVVGILTFFSGFMRLMGFIMGQPAGTKLVLHAVYAVLVSLFCFYTSQQLRRFKKSSYYLTLSFAVFMAVVAMVGFFVNFRSDLISALLLALLAVVSVYIAWGLKKGHVKLLFIH